MSRLNCGSTRLRSANPQLDDNSPLLVLRGGDPDEELAVDLGRKAAPVEQKAVAVEAGQENEDPREEGNDECPRFPSLPVPHAGQIL